MLRKVCNNFIVLQRQSKLVMYEKKNLERMEISGDWVTITGQLTHVNFINFAYTYIDGTKYIICLKLESL